MTARAANELKPIFSPSTHPTVSPDISTQGMLPSPSQNASSQTAHMSTHSTLQGDLSGGSMLNSTYDKLPATEMDRILRESINQHIPVTPSSPIMSQHMMADGEDSPLSIGGRSQRKRGRFSEPRRKEVQEVRKLGACLRCRILRKPVSFRYQ